MRDPTIKELRTRLENEEDSLYEMQNGLIYRKMGNQVFCKWVIRFPRAIEQDLFHKYHNDFGQDFGANKTVALLQETWFSNMKTKVRKYIRNCTKCIAFTKPSNKVEGA